jgi:hypothetical protein
MQAELKLGRPQECHPLCARFHQGESNIWAQYRKRKPRQASPRTNIYDRRVGRDYARHGEAVHNMFAHYLWRRFGSG